MAFTDQYNLGQLWEGIAQGKQGAPFSPVPQQGIPSPGVVSPPAGLGTSAPTLGAPPLGTPPGGAEDSPWAKIKNTLGLEGETGRNKLQALAMVLQHVGFAMAAPADQRTAVMAQLPGNLAALSKNREESQLQQLQVRAAIAKMQEGKNLNMSQGMYQAVKTGDQATVNALNAANLGNRPDLAEKVPNLQSRYNPQTGMEEKGYYKQGPNGFEFVAEGGQKREPVVKDPAPQIQMLENDKGQLVPVDARQLPLGQPITGLRKPTGGAYALSSEEKTNMLDGIKDGLINPAQASKRGFNSVLSEGAKQGIPMAQIELDWKAANRMAATMNSQQSVNFDTLSTTVMGTIDRVTTLADQLKLTGVPLYNTAKLGEIRQLEGNSPKGQLIGQYIAATTTLKEEYANFAQGGYAPTESAFKLGDALIKENYGSDYLKAALGETKRLVNIRITARRNLGTRQVLGPGGNVGMGAPSATTQQVGPNVTTGQGGQSPMDLSKMTTQQLMELRKQGK